MAGTMRVALSTTNNRRTDVSVPQTHSRLAAAKLQGRRMAHSHNKSNRRQPKARPQTRLVLPSITADDSKDDTLKSLIETWLVPRLVEEFIREQAANVITGEEQTSDQGANDENFRAAA
jgi:hypothetical protein